MLSGLYVFTATLEPVENATVGSIDIRSRPYFTLFEAREQNQKTQNEAKVRKDMVQKSQRF